MSYHLRIECKDVSSFQTTRTCNSLLWLVNNSQLEEAILGYAGRYVTRYEAKIYALAIEGNHIQNVALFPKGNRSSFMRDFNSSVARAVPRYQPNYPGGRLWARRFSAEYIVGNPDIEERFFYTVLQPVNDGLVDDIRKYPGYNCFEDAISGRERKYKVVKWKQYNDAKRWNPSVDIEKFTEICVLKYERLPGYEALSQKAYEAVMREKLQARTKEIVRRRQGKPFLGTQKLRRIAPGSSPKTTKTSGRYDHRPRVASKDASRRSAGKAWYFSIYFAFKESSRLYRAGELNTPFPEGTYKPPIFTVARVGAIPG